MSTTPGSKRLYQNEKEKFTLFCKILQEGRPSKLIAISYNYVLDGQRAFLVNHHASNANIFTTDAQHFLSKLCRWKYDEFTWDRFDVTLKSHLDDEEFLLSEDPHLFNAMFLFYEQPKMKGIPVEIKLKEKLIRNYCY